jgi:hypothetical protein
MAGGVDGPPRGGEAKAYAQPLYIPENVSLTHLPTLLRAEDNLIRTGSEIQHELCESSAQFNTEGNRAAALKL